MSETTGNEERIEAMAKAMEEQVETTAFSGMVPWETASESRKAYFRKLATVAKHAACPPGYVVVSRDDLEDVVRIADEADVYIDRRLAALDRMWELLRKEQE